MGFCSSFRGKMVTADFIICVDYYAASQCFSTTGVLQEIMTTFASYSSKEPGGWVKCLST